ncbi:MAG TPA: phenylacetate--CoA ligase [Candidatus Hydrogenedens sp.]|nr:phenylacetate--CoA ligase [Candidatus Hydrogenedens sp.]HOL20449.1 phenylacetate--CoA ligase [Candidatus Hydrogenedens sp.]HPP57876.1 phenylacetate--CoA ligase [Candidatus Hydrogenedens sp.]
MEPKDREILQLKRLQDVVTRIYNTVPFYKDAFDKAHVRPEDISSLDDLKRLPFTVKEDLRQNYPLGLVAVPHSELARIHGSSGTTGKPTLVAYTRNDIETWANLCARFLVAGGLRKEHFVQISFGYGLFTGGFGLHYGVEKVGATIIPAASGNTARQILLIQDLKPDVLICTPSYALNIAESAQEAGLNPSDLSLKYGHFGGEMWTDDMRKEIEEQLGIMAFNNYGLSEVIGPGVSGECYLQNGMHIQEDHFIVECLNPTTLEPVKYGEYGELVFTSLTKEAFPIIRYRTRDLAQLDSSPCPCGRTTKRMSRVKGRSDDMLIIRGVNVFPSQIEEAILQVPGIAPHYLIEVSRPHILDEISVKVEVQPGFISDKMSEMQALRDKVLRKIHDITGIHINVELLAPNSLERSTGKACRVIDHRKMS